MTLTPADLSEIAQRATAELYPHSACALVTPDEIHKAIITTHPSSLWRIVMEIIHQRTNKIWEPTTGQSAQSAKNS